MSHKVTFICSLVFLFSLLCSVGAPSTGAEGGIANGDNRSVGVIPQTLLLCFSVGWTGEVYKTWLEMQITSVSVFFHFSQRKIRVTNFSLYFRPLFLSLQTPIPLFFS